VTKKTILKPAFVKIVTIGVIKVEKRVSSCLLDRALFVVFLIRLMAETSSVLFLEVK